jgi:hypothetical protein
MRGGFLKGNYNNLRNSGCNCKKVANCFRHVLPQLAHIGKAKARKAWGALWGDLDYPMSGMEGAGYCPISWLKGEKKDPRPPAWPSWPHPHMAIIGTRWSGYGLFGHNVFGKTNILMFHGTARIVNSGITFGKQNPCHPKNKRKAGPSGKRDQAEGGYE